jgi:hypothetical protein
MFIEELNYMLYTTFVCYRIVSHLLPFFCYETKHVLHVGSW